MAYETDDYFSQFKPTGATASTPPTDDYFNQFKADTKPVQNDSYFNQFKPKDVDVTSLLNRIRGAESAQESTNTGNAVNPDSGALGKFQVMPSNVPSWTKLHYGQTLTPEQFKNNPQAQLAVFNGEMGNYLKDAKRKGVDDDTAIRMGAAKWYSGRPELYDNDKPQMYNGRAYPSIRSYTLGILNKSKGVNGSQGDSSVNHLQLPTFQPAPEGTPLQFGDAIPDQYPTDQQAGLPNVPPNTTVQGTQTIPSVQPTSYDSSVPFMIPDQQIPESKTARQLANPYIPSNAATPVKPAVAAPVKQALQPVGQQTPTVTQNTEHYKEKMSPLEAMNASAGTFTVDLSKKPKGENPGRFMLRSALEALSNDHNFTLDDINKAVDDLKNNAGKFTTHADDLTDEDIKTNPNRQITIKNSLIENIMAGKGKAYEPSSTPEDIKNRELEEQVKKYTTTPEQLRQQLIDKHKQEYDYAIAHRFKIGGQDTNQYLDESGQLRDIPPETLPDNDLNAQVDEGVKNQPTREAIIDAIKQGQDASRFRGGLLGTGSAAIENVDAGIARLIGATDTYHSLSQRAKAQAIFAEVTKRGDDGFWGQLEDYATSAPGGFLSIGQFGPLAKVLPGGSAIVFAAHGAANAAGSGGSTKDIIESGVSGYSTGGLFEAAGALKPVVKLATIAVGTGLIDYAKTGNAIEAVKSGIGNAAFDTAMHVPETIGKIGRYWKDGKSVDIQTVKNGDNVEVNQVELPEGEKPDFVVKVPDTDPNSPQYQKPKLRDYLTNPKEAFKQRAVAADAKKNSITYSGNAEDGSEDETYVVPPELREQAKKVDELSERKDEAFDKFAEGTDDNVDWINLQSERPELYQKYEDLSAEYNKEHEDFYNKLTNYGGETNTSTSTEAADTPNPPAEKQKPTRMTEERAREAWARDYIDPYKDHPRYQIEDKDKGIFNVEVRTRRDGTREIHIFSPGVKNLTSDGDIVQTYGVKTIGTDMDLVKDVYKTVINDKNDINVIKLPGRNEEIEQPKQIAGETQAQTGLQSNENQVESKPNTNNQNFTLQRDENLGGGGFGINVKGDGVQFVSARTSQPEYNRPAVIADIYVKPEAQSKGLGSSILKNLLSEFVNHGDEEFYTTTQLGPGQSLFRRAIENGWIEELPNDGKNGLTNKYRILKDNVPDSNITDSTAAERKTNDNESQQNVSDNDNAERSTGTLNGTTDTNGNTERPDVATSADSNGESEKSATKKLPPVNENFRQPLSNYSDTAYRETSVDKAIELMYKDSATHNDRMFMSNTENLAKGQDANKGVLIEFATDNLKGQVNTKKPGWQSAYDNGEAEFIASNNKQKDYQDAVRQITIKPEGKGQKGAGGLANSLIRDGWEKVKNEDGSLTFKNPKHFTEAKNENLIGNDNRGGNTDTSKSESINGQSSDDNNNKTSVSGNTEQPKSETGKSKVGQSISAKAVEKGLTDAFGETGDYNKISIKEQSEKAAKLINEDLDSAKSMMRGETPLPDGLKSSALLVGLENYATAKGDVDLLRELANSDLTKGTSEAAQNLRLLAERDPSSAVSKIQEIADTREAKAQAKLGKKPIQEVKQNEVDSIAKEIKRLNINKNNFAKFISDLKC